MDETKLLEGLIGPWPELGDQLMTSEGHGLHNAWLPNVKSLAHYIEGYHRASEIIGAEVESNPRVAGINFLVYPLVYICRHCLELSLKDIHALYSELNDSGYKYPEGHPLRPKWDIVKAIIKEQMVGSYSDEIKSVDGMIGELDMIDRRSTAFRYNIDNNGDPSLPSMEEINLAHFRDRFNAIHNFLNSVRCQLDSCISNKH